MKKTNLIIIVLFAFSITLLTNCTKTIIEEREELYATIIGFIKINEELGEEYSSFEGVTVKIDSTEFSTTTDTEGRYEIKDIPTGIYDISFKKEGIGDYYRYGYQLVGGETPTYIPTATMIEESTVSITNFKIESAQQQGYQLTVNFSGNINIPDNNARSILICLGTDSQISHQKNNWDEYTWLFGAESGAFTFEKDFDLQYSSNQKIYAVAVAFYPYANCSFYQNPYTSESITPTFSKPSNIISYTIP